MEALSGGDCEKIEIFISCRNLRDLDTFTKSDPKAKVSLFTQGKESKLGVTEFRKNDLNPNFEKSFIFDFYFEKKQYLKLEVWDHDKDSNDDFLGGAEISIATLMGSRNQVTQAPLKNQNKPSGTIIVKAEKLKESNQYIWWQWSGTKIKNVDGFLGTSDPFLRFFKKSGADWLMVHQTEHYHNNANPIFKPFEISAARLAPEIKDEFKVECWDNEKSGKHHYIGGFLTTPDECFNQKKKQFNLTDAKDKNKVVGILNVLQLNLIEKPSFVDYLRGGEQLNMVVAVDFTGSNGVPTHPSSLHAIRNDGSLNQYQSAIFEVCDVLLNYDYDKKVPVWGFGAKPRFPGIPPVVNHCFSISGSPESPEVFGLQGIMEAYRNALLNVELSGPTYFKQIIDSAMQIAKANQPSNIYTVLLILTDGEIHDMDETVKLISSSTSIPLSIIIIGVGDEAFENMRKLDGDVGSSAGGAKSRDIVQFVAFNDYKGNVGLLAQEVLAELPKQLVEYKMSVGKKPNPPLLMQMENLKI